jgi:cytochrome P450
MPKNQAPLEVLFSIIKKGLVGVEGKAWRHRRKLLSKIFNFDFIKEEIPLMVAVADNVFNEF